MGEIETPIDIGAAYIAYEGGITNTHILRVTRIWIDEDLNPQIEYQYESLGMILGSGVSPLDEFIGRINDGKLTRHNSDHEAYTWRENHTIS